MMRVRCQCGATYDVAEEMAGRTAKCRCGATLRMPAAASAVGGSATGRGGSMATGSAPPVADSISVTCASCQRQHQAPKNMAGRFARCPCGNALQIPHPYAATPGLVPLGPNASQATTPLLGIPVDPLTGQSHDGSLLDDLTHVDYERSQQLSTPSALQAPRAMRPVCWRRTAVIPNSGERRTRAPTTTIRARSASRNDCSTVGSWAACCSWASPPCGSLSDC